MAFNISPNVYVTEQSFDYAVQERSNYIGATAGYARWGAANKPVLLTGGKDEFINKFFKPDDNTYLDILTLFDFFGYSKKAWFTRVIGDNARNAVEGSLTPVLVRNEDEFTTFSGIQFMARYAGSLGNGLIVDVADSVKFANWEFKNSFEYTPNAGEYSIAVIDGSGKFSGQGQAKQVERLSIYNTASGGIKEARALTLSGTVAGGIQQVETISFGGTSTGTTITVNGTAVTIANGDTATQVATKVATALAAVTATYQSAVASAENVTVTFKVPALRTVVASGSSTGLTWQSTITTAGDDTVSLTLYGATFNVKNADTANTVAAALKTQLEAKTNLYSSVSVSTNIVSTVAADYGVSTYPTTSQSSNGITVNTSITTNGSSDVTLSIYGVNVTVQDKETPVQVATKIATALNADSTFTNAYEAITAERGTVLYRNKLYGKQVAKTSPATQSGLDFISDVITMGRLGAILERYEVVTANSTDRYFDGTTKYFFNAINTRSKYIFIADKSVALSARTVTLQGGVDDYSKTKVAAIQEYANAERYDVNYLWVATNSTLEQKTVSDVVDTRRDCIAFIAPMLADVVKANGNELANVLDWFSVEFNRDSTYNFVTDNWALYYDEYADTNRWIPTVGGTAGLAARAGADFEVWFSIAGQERGRYKNYQRLAWNASKEQRDELYRVGVNSVVDFPANGILLYGDKMGTSKPTAFNRYNVRMAFIYAEKNIANFSKRFLFELNDSFTRAQFLNAVRPFLRNMQAKRAFEDFKVIADERNNNAEVRAQNKMVATIMIKPNYSINWIQLDFISVRPDVQFEEIEKRL